MAAPPVPWPGTESVGGFPNTPIRKDKSLVYFSKLVHRHYADAFVYVLEGSVVMQVKGGKEVMLAPGQTFYEGHDDVHIVGRNASTTRPARMLVVLVKDKGAPILVPVK